ncbi:MAG: hypothetical protein KatS3mg052_2146 [Candidatus Roseilinea sp.]|nr:MAG: hypothetical protein KatS3mg052_2146 [Candidatus Roseilinea sp.]
MCRLSYASTAAPSVYRQDWLAYTEWDLLHSVEDAVRLGVQAVVVMAFIGIPVELQTFRIISRVARECAQAGLTLMVEALPCPSERIPDAKDARAMASAARLAFEHGADLVKTYYTGSPESFRLVSQTCPVPVLIAGGPKMETPSETLQVAYGALEGGAAGVVFGRNVWQSGDAVGVVRALRCLIHEGVSVEAAIHTLQPA